jgi:hypothetical protein
LTTTRCRREMPRRPRDASGGGDALFAAGGRARRAARRGRRRRRRRRRAGSRGRATVSSARATSDGLPSAANRALKKNLDSTEKCFFARSHSAPRLARGMSAPPTTPAPSFSEMFTTGSGNVVTSPNPENVARASRFLDESTPAPAPWRRQLPVRPASPRLARVARRGVSLTPPPPPLPLPRAAAARARARREREHAETPQERGVTSDARDDERKQSGDGEKKEHALTTSLKTTDV